MKNDLQRQRAQRPLSLWEHLRIRTFAAHIERDLERKTKSLRSSLPISRNTLEDDVLLKKWTDRETQYDESFQALDVSFQCLQGISWKLAICPVILFGLMTGAAYAAPLASGTVMTIWLVFPILYTLGYFVLRLFFVFRPVIGFLSNGSLRELIHTRNLTGEIIPPWVLRRWGKLGNVELDVTLLSIFASGGSHVFRTIPRLAFEVFSAAFWSGGVLWLLVVSAVDRPTEYRWESIWSPECRFAIVQAASIPEFWADKPRLEDVIWMDKANTGKIFFEPKKDITTPVFLPIDSQGDRLYVQSRDKPVRVRLSGNSTPGKCSLFRYQDGAFIDNASDATSFMAGEQLLRMPDVIACWTLQAIPDIRTEVTIDGQDRLVFTVIAQNSAQVRDWKFSVGPAQGEKPLGDTLRGIMSAPVLISEIIAVTTENNRLVCSWKLELIPAGFTSKLLDAPPTRHVERLYWFGFWILLSFGLFPRLITLTDAILRHRAFKNTLRKELGSEYPYRDIITELRSSVRPGETKSRPYETRSTRESEATAHQSRAEVSVPHAASLDQSNDSAIEKRSNPYEDKLVIHYFTEPKAWVLPKLRAEIIHMFPQKMDDSSRCKDTLIKVIRESQPQDLFICVPEHRSPDGSALRFLQQLRSASPNSRLKVILISSNSITSTLDSHEIALWNDELRNRRINDVKVSGEKPNE